MSKKIIAIALALVIAIGALSSAAGAADTPSDWAVAQVSDASARNLVPQQLRSDYTNPTTRAEFCILAVTLYEKVTSSAITGRATFTDTTDVNVQKAAYVGVVNGVGGGRFDPDTTLTREQAATMLARLAASVGRPLSVGYAGFDDNDNISSWAIDAVEQCKVTEIMEGTGGNWFSPKAPYTREQSIVTMLRLYYALGGTGTPQPIPKRTVKVGVCIRMFDDSYMALIRMELESYLKSKSNDLTKYEVTIRDSRRDNEEEKKQVKRFIADGVDVLIVNLVNASSAAEIINLAKTADIPVVFLNNEPSKADMQIWDKATYVGFDPRQAGTAQGEIIRDLPDHGDADGDGVVRYVMIMGDPDSVDAQYRTEFSIKALTDAGIKVENLFQQRGDWEQSKGQELAASALAQFGARVDVIFCNNDGMALGAMMAIKAAGRIVGEDIYLVSVDAYPEAIDAIAAGDITGTVFADHISLAHSAADIAIKAADGKSFEKYCFVDYYKVTKSTTRVVK